ncbi:hypothetical protein CP965_11420 [Halarcobacter mediterraneus]|uniref:histidine kinase n=1 Tax=Halarcobacter mediterraneus TaxID=2023153 RepID=A0A4Q1ARV6_9BACT|nr:ABC transporter substrate-binding protein [Halarcobacter mediterraneus]RXK11785.1 hypothetical protein CP965_11420 [Halarcobacter mediterraneus]
MKYLFLLLFLFSFLYPQKLEKVKLQLQWKHQFEFPGFYAAKEKGFYKKAGFDVEFIEFDENMNIVEEVLSGNADFGLSFSSIIIDYIQGDPIIMLANFFKQSPLVLATQKNIKLPSDLKNKKIMGLLDSSHKRTVLTMLNKFDININDFIHYPREFSVNAFVDKKVDAISIFTTNEIYELNKLGVKYNILDPAVFGSKFYDLNLFTKKDNAEYNRKKVKAFKDASIKGWKYALENKEELVDIILQKYNTQNKTKEALLFESKQIEDLMLTKVYSIGSIDLNQLNFIADTFTQSQLIEKLPKKRLEKFIFEDNIQALYLTDKQKEYLNYKKKIKMCVDPNWMPLDGIKEGKHMGIAADFMKNISNKIKIPIKLVITDSWKESLIKVKKRDCDILALSQKTPSRTKYLNFTSPYLKTPLVLATKKGKSFINDIKKINNKKIAIVGNYSMYEILKNKYPDMNLIQVQSVEEGLKKVQQEKFFGLLDNSIVINNEIQKYHLKDIAITGQFQESFNLSIASRNDEILLNEILEKTLNSIDSITREKIFYKWNNLEYDITIDYNLIAQILFISIVILALILYWNLKLKEEIKKRKKIERDLKESEQKFKLLFNKVPIFLNSFDSDGKITLWNEECSKVFGWQFDELKNYSNPLELFYPDKVLLNRVKNSFKDLDSILFKEWTPQTKEGKKLVTKWANIPLHNGEVINVGYDITQQREYEIELRKKNSELKKAHNRYKELNSELEDKIKAEIQENTKHQVTIMEQSKLAQMGEMIENIAHQWRQPLAEINSTVLLLDATLSNKKVLDSEIEEKLLEIENLTKYMSNTINDFKNFFDPNKEREEFNIYENIQKTLKILNRRLSYYKIEVEIKVDRNISLNAYPDELNQVLLVLLNNSIDAFSEKKVPLPLIEIFLRDTKKALILYIKDNAYGINNKIIDKIFEPYFTTKHKSQGTGLGLYISKMIIEKGFNGRISVKNEDEGVCFILELPKGES